MTSITGAEVAPRRSRTASVGVVGDWACAEVLSHRDCQARPVAVDASDGLRPIFQQPWWLEAAQGAPSYREVRVYREERCLGRFPFGLRERFGLVAVSDADWSHLGGPILACGLTAHERRDCLEQLVRGLPRSTYHVFVVADGLDRRELQAVAERHGYVQSVLTTYVRRPEDWAGLSEGEARERILRGFSRKRRMHLRQAERRLAVETVSPADFVAGYEANLPSRYEGLRKRPLASAQRLLEAAMLRRQARILAARSARGEGPCFEAALACVWDSQRYYFWMSTRRTARRGEDRPHPDAIKLLALHALAHAQHLGLTFDTDGAVTPGAKHLYSDILGLGDHVEQRYVFERHTLLSAIYFSGIGAALKEALTSGPAAGRLRSLRRHPRALDPRCARS